MVVLRELERRGIGPRTWRRIARTVGEVIYGATIYDMVRDLRKGRARLENLFVLAVFGDLLGLPIMPPYYTLRLLPYIVPVLETWKRHMLRERDLTDLSELIEGVG